MSDTSETDAHSPASYAIIRPDGVRTDYVPADFARQLERERDEANAQMCQAIGFLSTIAEDCEAWLNGESDEPSMEFIKAVRDYARKAING